MFGSITPLVKDIENIVSEHQHPNQPQPQPQINPTTNVNELNQNFRYNLFPNPNKGITIETPIGVRQVNIAVFDPVGKVVLQKTVLGGTNATVDLSGLSQGLYFVKISDEENVKMEKVIYRK